jgi:hypothetical protein
MALTSGFMWKLPSGMMATLAPRASTAAATTGPTAATRVRASPVRSASSRPLSRATSLSRRNCGELDLFAAMLEARGATAMRCPLVARGCAVAVRSPRSGAPFLSPDPRAHASALKSSSRAVMRPLSH